MAFVTISTTQLFHAYNCRSNHSIFRKNIFKNQLLNRIKKDKLEVRLQTINEIIEFDNNTFNEHFS